MDSRGFSPDGYITDQDFFEDVIYRGIPASDNGCGWIAAYNIRRALGQAPSFEQVLREMDAMHVLRVPGPTTMNVMRAYLRKYVPDMRESCGREAALAAAVRSRMGILRYSEAGIPHFISFLRVEEGFRFGCVKAAVCHLLIRGSCGKELDKACGIKRLAVNDYLLI